MPFTSFNKYLVTSWTCSRDIVLLGKKAGSVLSTQWEYAPVITHLPERDERKWVSASGVFRQESIWVELVRFREDFRIPVALNILCYIKMALTVDSIKNKMKITKVLVGNINMPVWNWIVYLWVMIGMNPRMLPSGMTYPEGSSRSWVTFREKTKTEGNRRRVSFIAHSMYCRWERSLSSKERSESPNTSSSSLCQQK